MEDLTFVITHTHRHLPFAGKFHGVADQVPEDLPQTGAVGDHLVWQRQRRLEFETQPLLMRLQPGEVLQIRKEAGEVEWLVIELYFAPLHLIHIDNIVEDIAQRHRRDMDRFEVFFLFRCQVGIQQDAA